MTLSGANFWHCFDAAVSLTKSGDGCFGGVPLDHWLSFVMNQFLLRSFAAPTSWWRVLVILCVLAATAGTARHALVADDQMRSLFAYLRTLAGPTSVFAAPEDWSDPALAKRADRAAFELVLLMESGFARQIRDESWPSYQHQYGSAGGTETAIDLDTDLMRLAAGGSAGQVLLS